MSEVNLIAIKGRNIYFIRKHYRKIRQVLRNLEKLELENPEYLDAGYLIIDLNNKTIINCQHAFALPNLISYNIENLK